MGPARRHNEGRAASSGLLADHVALLRRILGIVMTFDAKDPAGHVHCMLSWSDGTA